MTSPGQQSDGAMPNPASLARPNRSDEGQASEHAIADALAGLDEIRQLPVAEHVQRFEAVHSALTDALSKAENLSSTSHGSGS